MSTASPEQLKVVSQPATCLKPGKTLLSWSHGSTKSRSCSAKSTCQLPNRVLPRRNLLRPLNLQNQSIEFCERLVPPAGKCIRCAFTE